MDRTHTILKRERTEHAKAIRRQYGDYSGMIRFSDKKLTPSDDTCIGTVTAMVNNKDNLLLVEYLPQ